MPKKTKKEKLLASYHRKLRLLENKQVNTSPIIEKKVPIVINETRSPVIEPVNRYFFSDLRKSLILTVVIIGVEVSLYFARLIK